jgi:hypothetical protein
VLVARLQSHLEPLAGQDACIPHGIDAACCRDRNTPRLQSADRRRPLVRWQGQCGGDERAAAGRTLDL